MDSLLGALGSEEKQKPFTDPRLLAVMHWRLSVVVCCKHGTL